jgi:hypothetical protein
MDLIQGIWPAWLGLEKKDFKFTGTGASTSVPLGYNIINNCFVLEMLQHHLLLQMPPSLNN